MYSDGTSALKTEYYTHDNRTNNRGNRQTKSVKRSVPRKSTKLIKKRIVAAVMLAFSMAFLVLFRYAAIAKEFSELTQAREKLELIMNQADGWCKVKYKGKTGYVKAEFME